MSLALHAIMRLSWDLLWLCQENLSGWEFQWARQTTTPARELCSGSELMAALWLFKDVCPLKLDCVSRGNSIIDCTDTVSFSKDFVTKLMTVCPTNRVMHLLEENWRGGQNRDTEAKLKGKEDLTGTDYKTCNRVTGLQDLNLTYMWPIDY